MNLHSTSAVSIPTREFLRQNKVLYCINSLTLWGYYMSTNHPPSFSCFNLHNQVRSSDFRRKGEVLKGPTDEKQPDSVSWETKEISNPTRIFNSSVLSQYSRKATPIMYVRINAVSRSVDQVSPRYSMPETVSPGSRASKLCTDLDMASLILLYPPSTERSIRWALDITGVEGRARSLIFSTRHPDNIRSTFLRWSDDDPTPKFCRVLFGLF